MRHITMTIPAVAAVVLSAAVLALSAEEAQPLTLAARGAAGAYAVVVPQRPSPCLRHAAEELTKYIRQMTGVTLPVAESEAAGKAIRLVSNSVGDSPLRNDKYFKFCVL